MSEFEHEDAPQTPIDRLFSDLYDDIDDDETLPYDSILLAIHSYLEEGVGLSSGQASTVVKGMMENETIPLAYHLEADRAEAFARLKVGLYTEVVPLYASLYTTNEFKSWLPGMMDVVLSGHNEEDDNCMNAEEYDNSHCQIGFCPVRTICNKIIVGMQEPDFTSYDYQYLPDETVYANLAQLDYLVAENYMTHPTGSLLYYHYKHLLEGTLVDFRLDSSEERA